MAEAKQNDDEKTKYADFSGKWELVTTDNMDEFLTAQGVGFVKRKLAAKGSMTMTIVQETDKILKINAASTLKTVDQVIILNDKEFEMESPMGHKLKVIAKWEDDTKQCIVMSINNLDTKKQTTMRRTMPSNDKMEDEVENDKGNKMVRKFKRV
eukprot:411088_1